MIMTRLILINITIYEPRASKTLTILNFSRLHEKVLMEDRIKPALPVELNSNAQ
jgi:hypothetical protein